MVKFLVLPRIKQESALIKSALEGKDSAEKKAAEHLQELLLKHCLPVILKSLPSTVGVQQDQTFFVNEYGVFGNLVFQRAKQLKLPAAGGVVLNKQTIVTPTN